MDQKPRHGLHLFGKQPFSELEPCRKAWYRSIRLSHGKSCGTCSFCLQRGIYEDTPYPMNLCLWAPLTSCGIAENDQRSLDLSSQHMASILKKNAAMFVLYHQLVHLGAIDCSYALSSHCDTDAIYFLGVSMLNLRFLTRMANLHKSLVTWQDDGDCQAFSMDPQGSVRSCLLHQFSKCQGCSSLPLQRGTMQGGVTLRWWYPETAASGVFLV